MKRLSLLSALAVMSASVAQSSAGTFTIYDVHSQVSGHAGTVGYNDDVSGSGVSDSAADYDENNDQLSGVSGQASVNYLEETIGDLSQDFCESSAGVDFYFTVDDGDPNTSSGSFYADFGGEFTGLGDQGDAPELTMTLDDVSDSNILVNIDATMFPDFLDLLFNPTVPVLLQEGKIYHVHISLTDSIFGTTLTSNYSDMIVSPILRSE